MRLFKRSEKASCRNLFLASSTDISNDITARDAHQHGGAISSLSVGNTVTDTGVTSFVQEAVQSVDVLDVAAGIKPMMRPDKSIQDLTDYFSRPVAIASGTIPTASLTHCWMQNSGVYSTVTTFKNGLQRLSGVYGMRYTLVYTLQVSATPFHQGVLCLNWQYRPPNYQGVFFRGAYHFAATNLPHVRLDLSTDTMVQLRVPFLTTTEYCGLLDQTPIGRACLTPICSVPAVTGLGAPSYQIFLHLEDVELFGAMPQETANVVFQGSKKLSPIAEEFETEAYPFSSSVHALSRAVKWISKGVPALSSVGGPTSWFLQKAAGAIRAFGFARPQIVDPISRTLGVDNVAEQNVDVPTACQVCGPMASNMLRTGPEFGGSDIDEMALKYVTSQWSQINHFTLDTNVATGTLVYATPVCPLTFWFRFKTGFPALNIPAPTFRTGTSADCFFPSSLFFFASMFRYWRGSVKFRFTVSKTKMHSGRIMVTYTPGHYDMTPGTVSSGYVPSFGAAGPDPFGHSAIFNLRDGNIFEFEVPYICSSPFTFTDWASGTLSMHVVDPLLAPSVVSSVANVIVEVCGGQDFEFANVRTPLYPAHSNGEIILQAGRLVSQCADNVSEFTVGESINSLRQLIALPKIQNKSIADNTVPFKYFIPPWYYQPMAPKGATRASFPRNSFGFGGNIASCFAFARGGTDFHAYMVGPSLERASMAVTQVTTDSLTPTGGVLSGPTSANPRIIASASRSLHARLPAYQRTIRLDPSALNSVFLNGFSWNVDNPSPIISGANTTVPTLYVFRFGGTGANNGANLHISSSAADDAALAMYMGPPPLALLSVEAPAPYDPDETNIFS